MLLQVDGLEVHYGRVPAIKDVSLRVAEGETVSMIGRNGAGKTTTLSAIAGLVRPANGRIQLNGDPLSGLAPESVVRRGVSLVPEGRQIFATLTVGENLRIGSTIRRDRTAVDADLEEVLERFPALHRYLASPAGELSGGEQQQLSIARALLARPRLLLLDEPSLGLAPKMVDLVFEALETLRGEGVSMLLVEQNARRAVAFADRTYVLQTGRVRMETSREEILTSGQIEEAYLGI